MRKWLVMFACCVAGGAIPALLMWMFSVRFGTRDFLSVFLQGCAFSFSIGFLAWTVMSWLQPRICRLSGPVQWLVNLVLLVGLALVGSLGAILILMGFGMITPAQYWPAYQRALRMAIGMTLVLGAATTVVETLHHRLESARRQLREQALAEERARLLATEARLSSLESRIHPHFLFNTLNSISALIREDPAAAERTVERLAGLLRYSLDAHAHGVVPLRQELRVVADYLEIERTRFGERLRFSIDVPEELEELEVPPLALQTLVENSIKHAVAVNRLGGEVKVTARLDAGQLRLAVTDDGPGFDAAALQAGHGIENLQERLAALYHGGGALAIARRDGRTVVEVAVPQKKVLV
jgi:two-component system, LytTR family, sensor histidine kinase AlgZ